MQKSVLFFGAFFPAVSVGILLWLTLSLYIKECGGKGVLMCVPDAMIEKWLSYSILRLIDRMEVDPSLAFIALSCLCEFDWDAFRSSDQFSSEYKTWKQSPLGFFWCR